MVTFSTPSYLFLLLFLIQTTNCFIPVPTVVDVTCTTMKITIAGGIHGVINYELAVFDPNFNPKRSINLRNLQNDVNITFVSHQYMGRDVVSYSFKEIITFFNGTTFKSNSTDFVNFLNCVVLNQPTIGDITYSSIDVRFIPNVKEAIQYGIIVYNSDLYPIRTIFSQKLNQTNIIFSVFEEFQCNYNQYTFQQVVILANLTSLYSNVTRFVQFVDCQVLSEPNVTNINSDTMTIKIIAGFQGATTYMLLIMQDGTFQPTQTMNLGYLSSDTDVTFNGIHLFDCYDSSDYQFQQIVSFSNGSIIISPFTSVKNFVPCESNVGKNILLGIIITFSIIGGIGVIACLGIVARGISKCLSHTNKNINTKYESL